MEMNSSERHINKEVQEILTRQQPEPAFDGTILEGKERRYTIINERDKRKYLTDSEQAELGQMLHYFLGKISEGRAVAGKEPFNNYLVINTDEPYANQVAAIMKANGHLQDKPEEIVEIVGKELDIAFAELGIKATKTHQTPEREYKSEFQVWELPQSAYNKLIDIKDEDWKSNYGWWRTGRCIYEGEADVDYIINGQPMKGYASNAVYEDEGEEVFDTVFADFVDYMENAMDLTKNSNFVYFATSLATDNNMKISEFLKRYLG